MASFLLCEIKNVLRLEGFEVTKHTNRRVICDLLKLRKDSTFFDICQKLEMSYTKREGNFEYRDSRKIFLHFLSIETTWSFDSLREASKKIGINLLTPYDSERTRESILVNGEKAVLSFNNTIDRDLDFSRLENKISINLALSSKLGYTVDYEISLPEIFSVLGEEIPSHMLKEKLCQLLEIPYYFKIGKNYHKKKVLAKAQDDETLIFNSLTSAGKFFQTNGVSISKMIKLNYRIPFWFKRYTLKYV